MERIDSHHHFWVYDPREYEWIDDRMQVLRRDFLPGDLEPELRRARVSGTVPVQAHQSWGETLRLLQFANQFPLVKGVVGWIPLTDPDLHRKMPVLAEHPKLKGVRHNLQDEPDPDYMLGDAFNRGIAELRLYNLTYDILIYERHLPQTVQFVDRHPEQIFVLDHIGKPRIAHGAMQPWKTYIDQLAARPNVYCKISGMVTEADWIHWTPEQLRPYFDTVLEAFGAKRLIFGSDWPVCLLASSYETWLNLVAEWISPLTREEQALIWSDNTKRVYRLNNQ